MSELEIEFCMCLWNGDLPAAQKLLQEHPGLSAVLSNPEYRNTYFERAAESDFVDVLQFLVKHGADIHDSRDGAVNVGIIYPAVRKGALHVVSWLLDQGAQIHDECDGVRRCQPLRAAVSEGNLAMVKLLVEKGNADVNGTWVGSTPLSLAIDYGHPETAEYLRSRGAEKPPEDPPLESLAAYLTESVGTPNPDAIVEIVRAALPITIHVVRNEEEEHQILVTEGMSARPLNAPEGAPNWYAELAIRLPLDWPLDAQAFEEPAHFWPIQWLRKIAFYSHHNQDWLRKNYAVISNEEPPQPLAPNTELSCLLVLKADHKFGVWKRPDGNQVHFYELIPLYAEERDLELQQGLAELFDRFESYLIGQVVEVDRINVAVV